MKHYLVAASVAGIAASALATVEAKLYADTYIVKDGTGASAKFYSVLDVYAKGSHLADTIGCSVLGVGTHSVIVKTSQAYAGGDIFVHGGSTGNGWLPTDSAAKSWDSFIAAGNRSQGANAKVTNRAGSLIDHGVAGNWTGASSFSQMNVAGSNFIDEGTASGWYSSKGGGAYSSSAASENPFARMSLYNSAWNATYGDLYRGADVLYTKGQMQAGQTTAAGAWGSRINASTTDIVAGLAGVGGGSLDFHWMIGRFAIALEGYDASKTYTLNVQFNMVGKNGSGTNNETGTTFSGALTGNIPGVTPTTPYSAYKVSNHFAFAVPAPGAGALLAVAGLVGRRRKA
jgi:hypothetical protein